MKNKKGIFFTILAIAILSLFIVSYTLYSSAQERKAVQKRISTLNNFVFSVERDLPRKMYISGFRIIFLSEKKMLAEGYISDFNDKFDEVFFNKSWNGNTNDADVNSLMADATFQKINENLQATAITINAFANLTNPSVKVTQDDPWNVKVVLTANLLIKDNTNLASWNRTVNVTAYIPVENFEDPLYLKGTNRLVSNKINKTSAPIANLQSHAENSYYIANQDAPSFLNRLKGNFSGDVNGIESLVDIPELDTAFSNLPPGSGLYVLDDKSIVDHIYFGPTNPGYVIPTGMPDWIKIDDNHCTINGGPYSCS